MEIKDWTKLIVCVMVLIATTMLMYWGKIPGEAGCSLIAAVLGYAFGNAHGVIETNRSYSKLQSRVTGLEEREKPSNSNI